MRLALGALVVAFALGCGDAAIDVGVDEPATREAQVIEVAYGDLPSQFGELWLPERASGVDLPVVVLVHGGFWLDAFDLSLMDPLAEDLVARGYAVWNVEYRRVGMDGGGWPTTFDDVAAAMDHLAALADEHRLDLDRVAAVGHSAGGHLVHWLGTRTRLPDDAPWADPVIEPVLIVGQAPVVDLRLAAAEGAGNGAVEVFLGGGADLVPDRYDLATPAADVEAELLIVHGELDRIVLARWTSVGSRYDEALMLFEDADHFSVIDPTHESWAVAVEAIDRAIGG